MKMLQLLPLVTVVAMTSCKKDQIDPNPSSISSSISDNESPNYNPDTIINVLRKSSNARISAAELNPLTTVNTVQIYTKAGSTTFFYQAGLEVSAAGSPRAFHQNDNVAQDYLSMAGAPGQWWGLVTNNGTESGTPIIQPSTDPAPGYYVSTTALSYSARPATSQRKFVNASTVPYISISAALMEKGGAKLGDFVAVVNKRTGAVSYAIVANITDAGTPAEGSIALAKKLGVDSNPKVDQIAANIIYVVFPGSGNGTPRSLYDISTKGSALLKTFGGADQLVEIFAATSAVPGTNTSAEAPLVTSAPAIPARLSFTSYANIPVYKKTGSDAFFYKSKFMVDADGSPKAYHQNDAIALDHLEMAGYPGNWWALATDNSAENGTPLIQKSTDPAPGYYVSMTSLADPLKANSDPSKYVNAEVIPYMVLPSELKASGQAQLGDFAVIYNSKTDKMTYAIFADVGPEGKLGEGSIKAANDLGINSSPKFGGVHENDIVYLVFPKSGNGRPRSLSEIQAQGQALLNTWGGLELLKKYFQNPA